MIDLNEEHIVRVCESLRFIKIPLDDFTNPNYYPVKGSLEDTARYFVFMVAIDHRTSYKGVSYEETINGKLYHGADLLYKLGAMKYEEDPEFFSPRNMAKITVKDVKAWLNHGKARIWDIGVRTMLLRDLGLKLIRLYNGKVLNLIAESKGYLKKMNRGLINSLKTFKAYEDPVEKKAYLLVKFLERRKIMQIKDQEHIEIPVDNHLTRIAFRIGIVDLSKKLVDFIVSKKHLTYEDDVIIRLTVRRAYKLLCRRIGISPLLLDDLLWALGRKCCTKPLPKCDRCKILGYFGCPVREVCRGYRDKNYAELTEHTYVKTWYY